MTAAIINALKYLPASVGIKALQKISPKFKNYFLTSAAYGLDANRAFDYLADRFTGSSDKDFVNELQKRQNQGTLRPDEAIGKQSIERSQIPGKIARSAASYLGAGALNAINDEPSEDIQSVESPGTPAATPPVPEQKISRAARIPEVMKPTFSEGEDPLDFLDKYSPLLSRAIGRRIQSGYPPRDSALIVKANPGSMKKFIDRIEKDTQTDFEDFVDQLFSQPRKQQDVIGIAKQRMQANQERVRNMESRPEKTGGLNPNLAEALAAVQQALKR